MTLYLLNLADLLFTLHAVSHGGTELNPLMQNIPFMVVYKTIVVGALCWWLHHFRGATKMAGILEKVATAAYAAVNAWHIWNQIFLIGVIL